MSGNPSIEFSGANRQSGFHVSSLFTLINRATQSAKMKLSAIQQNQSSVAIGDMFEMQMLMNHLSQLSEMATNVVSASNSCINDMTRKIAS